MDANLAEQIGERPDNVQPERNQDRFPFGLALIGLTAALGLFSFLNSPYFHVAEVVLQGNKAVGETELLDLAAVYPGDNILQVDLRKVAGRVAAHPRVRHVHVDRQLPDTLLISVQEHVPVAWAPSVGDEGPEPDEAGADANGSDLVPVNEAGLPIPLIGDEGGRLPVVSLSDPGLLTVAVNAAADMPDQLRARILSIDAVRGEDGVLITAHTRTGGVILFGDKEELPRKAAIASSLLETADYVLVDVRFPRSPAVRPR